MNDFNRNHTAAYGSDQVIDTGLQSFMRSVYNTMCGGLALTGAVAFGVAQSPLITMIYGTPLQWVVMLAPLAFILFGFTPARVARMEIGKLRMLFYTFAALMGLSLSYIFIAYTGASVARVFFITAATFAATSLWGYTTKRDLSGMGSFLFMGMIGILIAGLVNMILGSAMVQFIVSILGVVIFTGLAAFETQMLKETYRYGGGANDKVALMGALNLYLSFVNMFQFLLSLMGNRE